VVVHIYNPSYLGGIGKSMTIPSSSVRKARTNLKNNLKQKKGRETWLNVQSTCLAVQGLESGTSILLKNPTKTKLTGLIKQS
jgi:hypothetical protein